MSRRDARRRSTYAPRSRAHREAERTSSKGTRRAYHEGDLPPGARWTLRDEIEAATRWYDECHEGRTNE